MLDSLLTAVGTLVQSDIIVYVLLGSALGLFMGAMPGLSSIQGLVLVLPFTFNMEPMSAMFLYAGIMGAGAVGGAIPSILLRIPGTSVNIATLLDGYPMTLRGESAKALGIASSASAFGTFFGLAILIGFLPIIRSVVLAFSPPEMFMLVLWGLCSCVVISRGNMVKGLIAACLGLALSYIGLSNISGVTRFSFGSVYLAGAIGIVPFIIGLFGIGQVIKLAVQGSVTAPEKMTTGGGFAEAMNGAIETFRHKVCFLRSAGIGTLIGIIPGIGGAVANFLSYLVAMQTSRKPETFGKGNTEGVIASEAANNASQQGAFLTMLSFGIPGGVETALLIGIFILHGLTPGPMLIREHLDIIWALILGIFVSNILASGVTLLLANRLAVIVRIPLSIILPLVSITCFVSVFLLRGEILDVLLVLTVGLFSYGFEKYGFSLVALVIGFVMGTLVEVSFHQSLGMAFGSYTIFFTRPISLVLFCLVILTMSLPFLIPRLRSLKRKV